MSMLNRVSNELPEVYVSEQEFGQLGLLKIVDRAVRRHGSKITLKLPDGKSIAVMGDMSHARYWQENEHQFGKDVSNPQTGVALTRRVLGDTLLTSPDGDDWRRMRSEMMDLLAIGKQWFQRPLASATQELAESLTGRPEVHLLDHCLQWATRAVCDPIFGASQHDRAVAEMVRKSNHCFLDQMSSEQDDTSRQSCKHVGEEFGSLLKTIAKDCNGNSITGRVIEKHGGDDGDLLRNIVGGLLVASLHINGLSLFWALVHLSGSPELQSRIAAEANSLGLGPRRIHDTPLAFAALRESQRLTPVMAFIERQTMEDIAVDGVWLPKGTTVLFSPWLVQRSPDAWQDPLEFRPERFLGSGQIEHQRYFPFGIGKRVCPGQNLVIQQIVFAIATICHLLTLRPSEKTRPGDLAPMFRVNLEPRGPVSLRAETRFATKTQTVSGDHHAVL